MPFSLSRWSSFPHRIEIFGLLILFPPSWHLIRPVLLYPFLWHILHHLSFSVLPIEIGLSLYLFRFAFLLVDFDIVGIGIYIWIHCTQVGQLLLHLNQLYFLMVFGPGCWWQQLGPWFSFRWYTVAFFGGLADCLGLFFDLFGRTTFFRFLNNLNNKSITWFVACSTFWSWRSYFTLAKFVFTSTSLLIFFLSMVLTGETSASTFIFSVTITPTEPYLDFLYDYQASIISLPCLLLLILKRLSNIDGDDFLLNVIL